mmetsp:Transcript_7894/g.16496  ORF Transcript_7894/g.16496 Transcript_7894/m.16496 type:complete len:103 (+) Transcript_7894:2106-2414(+)
MKRKIMEKKWWWSRRRITSIQCWKVKEIILCHSSIFDRFIYKLQYGCKKHKVPIELQVHLERFSRGLKRYRTERASTATTQRTLHDHYPVVTRAHEQDEPTA